MVTKRASKESSGLQVIPGGAAGLEARIAQAEENYIDAAQRAAPYAMQLQLVQELAALRALRLIGQGAVSETAELTEDVTQQMAASGFLAQVIIDGSRGKVDDVVITNMQEVQAAFSEGSTLIHALTTGSIVERVQSFRAPAAKVSTRDVITAVALRKLPPKRSDR